MEHRNRFPAEVRERVVPLVLEHSQEYASQWAAILSIAAKIEHTPETLRRWVRCEEVGSGMRNGLQQSRRSWMH
jgi:transposase-like protein